MNRFARFEPSEQDAIQDGLEDYDRERVRRSQLQDLIDPDCGIYTEEDADEVFGDTIDTDSPTESYDSLRLSIDEYL